MSNAFLFRTHPDTTPADKARERAELEELTAAYLKSGGKVKRCEPAWAWFGFNPPPPIRKKKPRHEAHPK